ncbi:MAG: hypothetical protein ACSHWQ_07325, partial [Spongiibacteraceae bacterium]
MLTHSHIATRKRRAKLQLLLASSMACSSLLFAQPQQYSQLGDLSELDLEALMNIEVVSVSKHSEPLQKSAAAIHVLQGDTIE